MFLSLILYLVILIQISNQQQHEIVHVILLDDNLGGEATIMESIQLLPAYFLNDEDFPSNITIEKSSSIACLDRIDITKTRDFKYFLSFEMGNSVNKEVEKCNDNACIIAPKSTENNCPMDQLYESIKIAEFSDDFFLFARGCYYDQFGKVKYEGGFIYQKNNKLSKSDYALMLEHFGIQKNINMTDLHETAKNLISCTEVCNQFFRDFSQNCKYIAIQVLVDRGTDIFIFISVAFTLSILAVLVSVFYYNY